MTGSETDLAESLSRAIEQHLGVTVTISDLHRLTGGASRETWSFDAIRTDGAATMHLVLGRDRGRSPLGLDRVAEARLLRAADAAGVPVPAVRIVLGADNEIGPAYVADRLAGETIPRKILRSDDLAQIRPLLASECGRILARIHAIEADAVELPTLSLQEQIARFRAMLDAFGAPHPALELGMRWMETHAPPARSATVVHGDFRNGNMLVTESGINGVLDWELAHIGDPMADLGWLCVRSWRFGNDSLAVGGFGDHDALLAAYEEESGMSVHADAVRSWEIFGNVRWGVICLVQAFTHINGIHPSVELAAIGRRTAEPEYDLVRLLEEVS